MSENLPPGATVSRTVTITSPAGAEVNSYPFTETVTNDSTGLSASAEGSYIVKAADTTSPDVWIRSPAASTLPKKGSVLISATASDANGISRMVIRADGAVLKTCLNTILCEVKWNVTKLSAGTYTISVEATDNAKPTANTGRILVTVTK
jgi:hypothetical protein